MAKVLAALATLRGCGSQEGQMSWWDSEAQARGVGDIVKERKHAEL